MKVLMIGAGDIARSHARAVVKLGGSIVGAYDVNAEGLRSFAKEFDCDQLSYEQIPEYVERADYAVISTPPTKRLDYCEMVLSRHVPLYLEKPIATTMEDALKIVDMAKKYDAKIIVGFAHRYRPAFVKMHELVASGMFGEPVNDSEIARPCRPRLRLRQEQRRVRQLLAHRPEARLRHDHRVRLPRVQPADLPRRRVRHHRLQRQGHHRRHPQYDTNSTMVMRCKNGAVASIMTSWSSGRGRQPEGLHRHQGQHPAPRPQHVRVRRAHLQDRRH